MSRGRKSAWEQVERLSDERLLRLVSGRPTILVGLGFMIGAAFLLVGSKAVQDEGVGFTMVMVALVAFLIVLLWFLECHFQKNLKPELLKRMKGKGSEAIPVARFKLFDHVKVVRLAEQPKPFMEFDAANARAPKIGDIGVVMEIYDIPTERYCVECMEDEETIWLADFAPDELDFTSV